MKKLFIPKMPECLKVNSKPHKFCSGCGHGIILKTLGEVIDELKIAAKTVFMVDIGCSLLAWDFFDIKTTQTHHGRTTATAVGYKLASPASIVIAYMGDGGGYAIGLQNLLHAALRNTAISVFLVNNANYGMTGGQMAPTTLPGQKTDSTPFGKRKEDFGPAILGPELIAKVASPNSFLARSSVAKPLPLKITIRKCLENQINNKSFSFLEILSFCPTNWRTTARETLDFLKIMESYLPVGETKVKSVPPAFRQKLESVNKLFV